MDYGSFEIAIVVVPIIRRGVYSSRLSAHLNMVGLSAFAPRNDCLTRKSIHRATRSVFPKSVLHIVEDTAKGRRYQVTTPVRRPNGSVEFEVTDHIRVLKNGTVICELHPEFDKHIVDFIKRDDRVIKAKSLLTNVDRILTDRLYAIRMGGAYLVCRKGLGIRSDLKKLQKLVILTGNKLYTFPLYRNKKAVRIVATIVSQHLYNMLTQALEKARRENNKNICLRKKAKVKRLIKMWESRIGLRLIGLRKKIAVLVADTQELQDE